MSRRARLWAIGIATGVVGLALAALDGPMWDAGGPGIVGFELAGSEARADNILVEWGEEGRDAARWSLWLDFLYLAGYGAFWWLAVQAVGGGRRAALTAPLAAAFDAAENVALLLVLGGHGGAVAPPVAFACAVAKFALIGFAVLYVVVALVRRHRVVAAVLAAAAVLAVVATVLVVDRQERGAEPVLTALADGRIRAAVEGDPRNPPLLLVHGFSVDHHWWDRVAADLARRFYVVRPDLLGHGASDKPLEGYAMESQADRLRSALLSVPERGDRPFTVVGHSMGGVVATALAERHPQLVDRLMLIGTGPDVGNEGRTLSRRTPAFVPVSGHLVRAFVPDDWIRAELEVEMLPEVDLSPAMAEAPDRTTWRSFRGSAEAIADYTEEAPIDARVRRTGKPFAAVFGVDDEQGEKADRYRRIRGARVIELPGLGHSPMLERPGLTARLIADFALL